MTRIRVRTPVAVAVAALALAVAVAGASANQLGLSDEEFSIRFREFTSLMFTPGEPIGTGATCPVTMTGSFHDTTLQKESGALAGMVTNVVVDDEACEGSGAMTFLSETLPWHVTYETFAGALPDITEVVLYFTGLGIAIEDLYGELLITCLSSWTAEDPGGYVVAIEAGGAITGASADPEIAHRAVDTNWFLCDLLPVYWAYSGTGAVEDGEGEPFHITLI